MSHDVAGLGISFGYGTLAWVGCSSMRRSCVCLLTRQVAQPPARGELGDQLRVRHVGLGEVLVDEALVHLLADPPGHPAARAVRVEDVELALLGDDEGAALLGGLGAGGCRETERPEQAGRGCARADQRAASE